MKNEKIKTLEREVELLKQIIELTEQINKLKAAPPVYVPYPNPWQPIVPYDPWPIRYDPYCPSVTTSGFISVSVKEAS